MFHPGKVLVVDSAKAKDVVSADSSVQATVKMWDDNLVTFGVEQNIADKLKANDAVLVDYTPMNIPGSPVPRMVIVKILKGAIGKKILEEYESHHKKRRDRETQQQLPQPPLSVKTNYIR